MHFVNKLTGYVEFDKSINIRYAAIFEIDTESQKFQIFVILIYISITEKNLNKLSRKLKVKVA